MLEQLVSDRSNMPQRRTHYPSRQTDACDSEARAFGEGKRGRTAKQVQWPVNLLDEAGNRRAIKNPDRVDTIGSCLQIGVRPLDGQRKTVFWLADRAQEDIDARVNHKRDSDRRRQFAQRCDQVYLVRQVGQGSALMDERIFDVDAHNTSCNDLSDRLEHFFNRVSIACLDICCDGAVNNARDAGKNVKQQLPAYLLTVAIAQRGCDPGTGGRDGAEAGLLDDARARGIPDSREDEQRRFVVELAKAFCPFLLFLNM